MFQKNLILSLCIPKCHEHRVECCNHRKESIAEFRHYPNATVPPKLWMSGAPGNKATAYIHIKSRARSVSCLETKHYKYLTSFTRGLHTPYGAWIEWLSSIFAPFRFLPWKQGSENAWYATSPFAKLFSWCITRDRPPRIRLSPLSSWYVNLHFRHTTNARFPYPAIRIVKIRLQCSPGIRFEPNSTVTDDVSRLVRL